MKTKLLLMIIGTILCLGLLIAGGEMLLDKYTSISEQDKTILIEKGIDNVYLSEITCNNGACSYWITGKEINKQEGISLTKKVCDEKNRSICERINLTSSELDAIKVARANYILEEIANLTRTEQSKSLNQTSIGIASYVIINDKVDPRAKVEEPVGEI
jgi:hypothetical protein